MSIFLVKNHRGFTLIELMVVVGIFSLLTTIIVYKNGDFNNSILLTDTAYEVGLAVREAQVYGLNIKTFGTTDSETAFQHGYGIYLNSSTVDSMVFFVDQFVGTGSVGNYQYTADESPSELINTIRLTRGYKIQKFCVNKTSPRCSSDVSSPLSELSVVFVRPNPDAIITANNSLIPGYTDATITIVSPDGLKTKDVFVTTTGQISIQ